MKNGGGVDSGAVLAEYDSRYATYSRFTTAVEALLLQLINCSGIKVHSCTSRLKNRDSLERKIDEKSGRYSNLAAVTDVSGVRVITYYPTQVDSIAEIVEKEFTIDRANSIDKRAALDPDRFGYLSLHYVISLSKSRLKLTEYKDFAGLKAELQIRSIIQHAWAEIQHDLGYKTKVAIPKEAQRRFFRVAAILESADIEFSGLRSEIQQYEKIVGSKLIQQSTDNIRIDTNSLALFIGSNPRINTLDERVCLAGRCKLNRKVSHDFVGSIVEELAFAGVTTLTELQTELENHAESLVRLAAKWLGDPKDKHSKLSRGISLFYLAYVVVAARGGQKDIVNYLDSFAISLNEDRIAIATDILGALADAA